MSYTHSYSYQPPLLDNGGYSVYPAADPEQGEVRQPLLVRTGSRSPQYQTAVPMGGQPQSHMQQQEQPMAGHASLPISTLPAHVQEVLAQYGHMLHTPALPVAGKHQGSFTDPLGLPELPNAQRTWRAQRLIMAFWFLLSLTGLVVFAPFFLTTGLYLGAELAGVMGLAGACFFLCKRCSEGMELHWQVRIVGGLATAGAALDGLTALLNLLIIWGVDCQADDTCKSVMVYVLVFSAYVMLHGYLSHMVGKRARAVQAMLNPVSSGLVKL